MENNLKLPTDKLINGKPMPFVFVADDAFPLHQNIMKPFKPPSRHHQLVEEERIFNYRLSRARRCVENAFGILCARWVCLRRTLFVNPDRAQHIIAACCLLHNFLLRKVNDDYCPTGFDDHYDENGEFVEGIWRKNIPEDSLMNSGLSNQSNRRPTKTATRIRSEFKN